MTGPWDPKEGGAKPHGDEKSGPARVVGIGLLAFAVLMWISAPAVLLLPLSGGQKLWMGTALLVAGEVAFWVSAFVLGREVFRRYRGRLDPRRLWGRG
ncbi:transporter suffix domain-containing protein [Rubrobacter tropicus]|uniref:Transporter suffix domain-containing protein n=1 Tax=Rubrobacter tropicus TaxID=2653851 RepID=A0A6G8Q581_9ACTN|nr:transporter suffix domain-containing protein [Rubrobacter tropicus]QIN81610.1 transporter suffix domain-containing protein [Rubrobacter tropicus]